MFSLDAWNAVSLTELPMKGRFFRRMFTMSGKGIWEKPMLSETKIVITKSKSRRMKYVFHREERFEGPDFSFVTEAYSPFIEEKMKRGGIYEVSLYAPNSSG